MEASRFKAIKEKECLATNFNLHRLYCISPGNNRFLLSLVGSNRIGRKFFAAGNKDYLIFFFWWSLPSLLEAFRKHRVDLWLVGNAFSDQGDPKDSSSRS